MVMVNMKILLVEPSYRRTGKTLLKGHKNSPPFSRDKKKIDDEKLWYPPIGLLKLARFHKLRGDEVRFVSGCDNSTIIESDLFELRAPWDRVYITTLFTFDFKKIIDTVNFYKQEVCCGTSSKIFIGGIMASLMPDDIFRETGIFPVVGVLHSPKEIGLDGDEDIDSLPPDYSVLPNNFYAINSTYYAYTSRGCVNQCPWCGVPKIEPKYVPYIDIKASIRDMTKEYGEKPVLKLMDNNILASPHLGTIIQDLVELGFGRGEKTKDNRTKYVDFNQGVDASFFTEERISILSRINIKPMRIAFDRASEKNIYIKAIQIAFKYGFRKFSNYMLYNCEDTPYDLFFRLTINTDLNEFYRSQTQFGGDMFQIYSYPMRFAPINENYGPQTNRVRDKTPPKMFDRTVDWLRAPQWTKRFIRNVEIMKGAAHGAISPTTSLARRTVGVSFLEFITNLYMPEELLRNRNKHEKKVYKYGSNNSPGTGYVERFRDFLVPLLETQDDRFWTFHCAVAPNTQDAVKKRINFVDEEMKFWLSLYLK